MSVFEWDDFGCNHIISDQCQSHDCRDQLDKLHTINPAFKCTLFAIPWEMTPELAMWCHLNKEWVEVAVHGFSHSSNYECEKMDKNTFHANVQLLYRMWPTTFKRIFRAPGWQISDDVLHYLAENDWIIADQGYNDDRRPEFKRQYINYDGVFKANGVEVEAYHGHTWDVGWNGIYEDFDKVKDLVTNATEFKFITELF